MKQSTLKKKQGKDIQNQSFNMLYYTSIADIILCEWIISCWLLDVFESTVCNPVI